MSVAVAQQKRSRRGVVVGAVAAAVAASAIVGYLVGRPSSTDLASAAAAVAGITVADTQGGTVAGSALVVTPAGEIVTAYHLVSSAERVAVVVGGRSGWASPVAIDPEDDIAILEVLGAHGLSAAPLDAGSAPRMGDTVTLVTHPGGVGSPQAVTTATVVAVDQAITSSDPDASNPISLNGVFEIAAQAPLRGEGGAIVDAAGRVVGMFVAGADRLRGTVSPDVGYALPMTTVSQILSAAQSGAGDWRLYRGSGGFLGIDVADAPGHRGALVTAVPLGTPAYVAGMQAGDVITGVGLNPVRSADDLAAQLRVHRGGDRVVVTYLDRSGSPHSVTVELAAATSG